MALNNLKKLQKLVATAGDESLTNLSKAELNEVISDLLDFLDNVNKKNRTEFNTVVEKLGVMFNEGRSKLEGDFSGYRGNIDSRLSETSKQAEARLAEHMSRMDKIEEAVEAKFGELFDGKSASAIAIIDALTPRITKPIPGSPGSAEDIRNKLELLSGEERLSVDAISGIDEKIKKAKGTGVSGIVAHRLDQVGDVDLVTTLPADGQVLAYDAANTKWVPSSAGAGTGDVTKVGIPVNNQVGVWTGNGTLEGDTALTFDTTTDRLSITTSGIVETGSIELGHASDTTITRTGAGAIAVEGVGVLLSGG